MILEVLNYQTSFLNPLLKIAVPILFLIASFNLFIVRNRYRGIMKKIIGVLMIAGIIGLFATGFRWLGDFVEIGFKWGESIFFLVFASSSIVLSFYLHNLLKLTKEVMK